MLNMFDYLLYHPCLYDYVTVPLGPDLVCAPYLWVFISTRQPSRHLVCRTTMTTLSDDDFVDFVQSISPFLSNANPVLDQCVQLGFTWQPRTYHLFARRRLQELITALPKLTEADVDLGMCVHEIPV